MWRRSARLYRMVANRLRSWWSPSPRLVARAADSRHLMRAAPDQALQRDLLVGQVIGRLGGNLADAAPLRGTRPAPAHTMRAATLNLGSSCSCRHGIVPDVGWQCAVADHRQPAINRSRTPLLGLRRIPRAMRRVAPRPLPPCRSPPPERGGWLFRAHGFRTAQCHHNVSGRVQR